MFTKVHIQQKTGHDDKTYQQKILSKKYSNSEDRYLWFYLGTGNITIYITDIWTVWWYNVFNILLVFLGISSILIIYTMIMCLNLQINIAFFMILTKQVVFLSL